MAKRSSSIALTDRPFPRRIFKKPLGLQKPNRLAILTRHGITRSARKLGLVFLMPRMQILFHIFLTNDIKNSITPVLIVSWIKQYSYGIFENREPMLLKGAPASLMNQLFPLNQPALMCSTGRNFSNVLRTKTSSEYRGTFQLTPAPAMIMRQEITRFRIDSKTMWSASAHNELKLIKTIAVDKAAPNGTLKTIVYNKHRLRYSRSRLIGNQLNEGRLSRTRGEPNSLCICTFAEEISGLKYQRQRTALGTHTGEDEALVRSNIQGFDYPYPDSRREYPGNDSQTVRMDFKISPSERSDGRSILDRTSMLHIADRQISVCAVDRSIRSSASIMSLTASDHVIGALKDLSLVGCQRRKAEGMLSAHIGKDAALGRYKIQDFEYPNPDSRHEYPGNDSQMVRMDFKISPSEHSDGRLTSDLPGLTFEDRSAIRSNLNLCNPIAESKEIRTKTKIEIKSPDVSHKEVGITRVDLDKLSNKIYMLLERRLATERERRGL